MHNSHNRLLFLAAIILIAAAAGYLRLGVVTGTVIDTPVRADAADYYYYAYNLSHYGIYSRTPAGQDNPVPDAVRSPGYPLFIAPFVQWPPTDRMLLNINMLQVLLGVGTVLLGFSLYRRFMNRGPAMAAAMFTAISPHLASFTAYLLSETLFTFLLVLALWLLAGLKTGKRYYVIAFLAGLALAAAALTRPVMDYFMIPLIGLLWYQFGARRGTRLALACLAGYAALVLPWLLRNLITLGHLSDPTLMTHTLFHGMYPDFTYAGMEQSRGFPYRFDPHARSISRDTWSVLTEIGRRFHEHPLVYLKWYLLGKPLALFSWNMVQGMGDIFIYPVLRSPYLSDPVFRYSRDVMYFLHWPLVLLSGIAAVVVWIPRCMASCGETTIFIGRLLSLTLGYFLAIHIVGAPFPRYGVPLRPVTYGLAVFCLVLTYRSLIAARGGRTAGQ